MVTSGKIFPGRRNLTVVLLLLILVLAGLRVANGWLSDREDVNPTWNQPRFNYSYNASEESLRLEVTTNHITPRRGSVIFDNPEFSQSYLLRNSQGIGYTNIWSHPSLVDILVGKASFFATPLALEGEQLADMPLEKGDYIKIEKDFTDTDSDGYQGIENNETIKIYNADRGVKPRIYAYVSIFENKTRVFRFDPPYERKWKPCDLEREKLCETVQAYNFN